MLKIREKRQQTWEKKQKSTQDDTCNSKKKSHKGKENQSQKPGTSYIYIDSDSTDPETDDDEILEKEKCCVCKQFTSQKIRLGLGFEITSWVQRSDQDCKHRTHLKYCTGLRAIRRGTTFYCIHCKDQE